MRIVKKPQMIIQIRIIQMKNKAICAFAAVCMLLGCFMLTAGAIQIGDIDADGRVSANDARIALRYSVKLENLKEDEKFRADTDADGLVMASDARTILRMSVGLAPSKLISNQYDMLRSGIYNYIGERLDVSTGQYEYFELARTADTIHLLISFEGVEIGMFIQDGNVYAVSDAKRMYLVTPQEVFDTIGINKTELVERYQNNSVIYPALSKASSVKDGMVDGYQCKLYRIPVNGGITEVSMCGGRLVRIREYDSNGRLSGETKFYSVSMSVPANKKQIPSGYKKYEGKLQAISFVAELLK